MTCELLKINAVYQLASPAMVINDHVPWQGRYLLAVKHQRYGLTDMKNHHLFVISHLCHSLKSASSADFGLHTLTDARVKQPQFA